MRRPWLTQTRASWRGRPDASGYAAWPDDAGAPAPPFDPKRALVLAACSLVPCLVLLWSCRADFTVLARYWDGPNYIEVAKTLYHVPADHPLAYTGTTPAYFACHLPLYPLLIRLLAPLLGYPAAMIAIAWVAAAGATVAFWRVLEAYGCVSSPFWSAVVSCVLPARWVIYKSVGATEPLFFLLVCLTLLAWRRDRTALALLWASLAAITRIQGLLFVAFFAFELIRTGRARRLPLVPTMLIPVLVVFGFYRMQFGNFWAYFSGNARLIHFVPMETLAAFSTSGDAPGAELYVAMYVVYGLGVLLLWPHRTLFFFSAVFYGFTLFVFHEDVSRYMLACAPFALVVAYDRILATPAFRLLFPLVVGLVLTYAVGLLPTNVADAEAWNALIAQPAWPSP